MKQFSFLFSACMFFTASLSAQKKQCQFDKWKIAAVLPKEFGESISIGFAGPITGINERVMIFAGGANFSGGFPWQGGTKKYHDEIYIYKKQRGKLKLFSKVDRLPLPVAYAAVCTTSKGVFYAGGENQEGISDKTFLLQYDEKTSHIKHTLLPKLPIPLTNASAGVYDNVVYVAGGETTGFVSNRFFCLNLNQPDKGWNTLASLPHPISHSVLIIQSNGKNPCIYLCGGRMKTASGISTLYSSLFEFDIHGNFWKEKNPLPYALSAGTGIAVNNDCMVLFGGDKGETFHKTEILIAAINNETDSVKRKALIVQKNQLQEKHPGFCRDILEYHRDTDKWSLSGTITFDCPVTTTAFLWDNQVFISSGEVRAGVRSPYILSSTLKSRPD